MVTFLVTLGDLYPSIPNSTFCVAFHIFVVGEHKDLKYAVRVDFDYKKSQPTDDKLSHVIHFYRAMLC